MWVEVTARAEPLPSSTALRVEAVMRDVTERKKLQDQARDVYHQLSQAEKLASLGQTMSGVAHELNNPLATILACAERLAGRRLDEQTRRDLDAIHNAAERAARIVRNLQTFARKRHTTRTMVDLNQVVRETLALRAYEQRVANVVILEALAAGPAAGVRRSAPDSAGAAEPDHQRRAGHAGRARPRHADPAVVARPRARRRHPRGEATTVRACRRTCSRRSSIRSSRRRPSAKAPGSGCPSRTRSRRSTAGASA